MSGAIFRDCSPCIRLRPPKCLVFGPPCVQRGAFSRIAHILYIQNEMHGCESFHSSLKFLVSRSPLMASSFLLKLPFLFGRSFASCPARPVALLPASGGSFLIRSPLACVGRESNQFPKFHVFRRFRVSRNLKFRVRHDDVTL